MPKSLPALPTHDTGEALKLFQILIGLLAQTGGFDGNGDLPAQTLQDSRSLVWFHNGSPVTQQVDPTRGPQFFNPEVIDDPVYQTQHTIYKKLRPFFELISANSFAYEGE